MSYLTTKGPGDEATWGPAWHPNDPRYEEPDHVENLLDEVTDNSEAAEAVITALVSAAECNDLPEAFFEGMRDSNYCAIGDAIYNTVIERLESDNRFIQSWLESKRAI